MADIIPPWLRPSDPVPFYMQGVQTGAQIAASRAAQIRAADQAAFRDASLRLAHQTRLEQATRDGMRLAIERQRNAALNSVREREVEVKEAALMMKLSEEQRRQDAMARVQEAVGSGQPLDTAISRNLDVMTPSSLATFARRGESPTVTMVDVPGLGTKPVISGGTVLSDPATVIDREKRSNLRRDIEEFAKDLNTRLDRTLSGVAVNPGLQTPENLEAYSNALRDLDTRATQVNSPEELRALRKQMNDLDAMFLSPTVKKGVKLTPPAATSSTNTSGRRWRRVE